MSFDNWRKRLEAAKLPTVAERRAAISALKINFSQPTLDDEGYYRKPVTRKKLGADGKSNGQTEIIGWEPVAYFIERHKLCGVIGDRDMAINEVTDEGLWSWVVSNPISEDWYRRVSERGEPWPDLDVVPVSTERRALMNELDRDDEILDPIERIIGRNHNEPPAEEVLPLDVQHATAIDNAIGAALTVIASEADAALAAGSKNRIAELRLKAEKAGKALYEPLYREYQAVQKPWPAMVQRAVAKEKAIERAILTFRESERKRIAKEQLEAIERQEAIDAANARAADRAIAAGEPEQAPVIEEIVIPQAAAPLVATYRAPGQRAAVAEVEKWFLDEITDWTMVYAHFKDNEVLKTTLKTLATAQVKLGHVVPGTKTHRGLV